MRWEKWNAVKKKDNWLLMFFKLNSSIFSAPCHPEHSLTMHTGLGPRGRLVSLPRTEEQGGSYRTRRGVLWWTRTQDSCVGTRAAAVFTCLWVERVLSSGKRTAERNVWMNEWLFWITPQIPWSSVSITGTTPTLRMVSRMPTPRCLSSVQLPLNGPLSSPPCQAPSEEDKSEEGLLLLLRPSRDPCEVLNVPPPCCVQDTKPLSCYAFPQTTECGSAPPTMLRPFLGSTKWMCKSSNCGLYYP